MGGRGKDLVAFAALLGAAMFGTWLFLRARLDLGAGWTDGTTRYEAAAGERIRHAVWDAPEPLGGEVNGPGRESRPALSPDGRWLVFAVGERGLNADLWMAELVGGVPRDPRPIPILNTAADELAPAFGPDGLVFASDRAGPTFGLDLFRAAWDAGSVGPPAPIGAGINTAADETDPCPVPGTADLVFSSNRPRGGRVDHDLWLATRVGPETEAPAPAGADEAAPSADEEAPARFEVAPLAALNTPFEEREAALTADGRTLVFASDRERARGFDLYRSFRETDGWLPPEPLVGVNTWRSERGPLLSPDGFSLYLDVEDDSAAADLFRARSRELFRLPAPGLSLTEVLVLVALLLLALLAWLAKRWRAIDVLYKCFLVSLLLHLALLWMLREVYPEAAPVELRGDDRAFRVRLASAPSGTPSEARERGGELERTPERERPDAAPSRAESGLELAAVAPARARVEAPQRPLEAPARSDADLAEARRREAAEPALEEREAPFERLQEAAPGLALAAREAVAAPTASAAARPNRSRARTAARRAEPSAAPVVATREAGDPGSDAPGPARLERTEEAGVPDRVEVARPSERFEAARAAAPAMTLPETTAARAPERRAGEASPRPLGAPAATPAPAEARPAAGALASLAAEPRLDDAPPGPRRPSVEAPETRTSRGDPSVELRAVHEAPATTAAASESPRFDATADLAPSPARSTRTPASAPDRFDVSPAREGREDAVPARRPVAGLAPVPDPEQDALRPADRAQRAPTAVRAAVELEVALRAPAEEREGDETPVASARRFEPAARLVQSEPRRFERELAAPVERPERLEAAPPRLEPARPTRAPLVAAAEPPRPEPDEAPRPLETTPYRNRFGDQKLRALEEFGGGAETERAVAAGLRYLASIQDAGGFWGERRDYDDKYHDVRVGKTALALLAFLGAGHTPGSTGEHAGSAERAVAWLLDSQSARNGHFGDSSAYGHGIATYALAETFAMTRDERLRGPIERGVERILAEQSRREDPRFRGGWGYYFEDGHVWNGDRWPRVSVTAWQVMALESARLGGIAVPDAAFEEARTFLLNAWDQGRQAFRYAHDPDRLNSGYPILPASTPAALFALSLLEVDPARDELAPARRFVLERAPLDYRFTGSDDFVHHARGNLYFWYYGTLALFRVGGAEWERWNTAMKETLLGSQEEDGSWRPMSVYADYAGDDEHERGYSTAMCVLTLEVYYRYFTPLLTVR